MLASWFARSFAACRNNLGVASTLDSCCGLGCGLGFGNINGVAMVLELSIKSVISVVLCECDIVVVLAASVVTTFGGHGSTHDGTDVMNLVTCCWLGERSLGLFFSRKAFVICLKSWTHDMSCFRHYRKNNSTIIQNIAYVVNKNNTTFGFMIQGYFVSIF